ncbi:hypothetical protein [Phenylobacterium sp.]|uniref:hypothetical protein n=1 Tax=Phenylobacterium sp. TaxID=1871053 RepID=UPI0025F73D5A|nr:hypothetical protein [Phenylobacterium sp.]
MRNLGVLQRTASTSRVLNLVEIGGAKKGDPEYHSQPFFTTPYLNQSLVVKHIVRSDERYVLDDQRQTATKVILPFERSDLRMGGRSFLVGQRGWRSIVREAGGDAEGSNIDRDIRLLTALDEIPSLDPFLLREHLSRRGFTIASCYFAISDADLARMHDFVASEIDDLIRLTFADASDSSSYADKLVRVLLSPEITEQLEPFRIALRLEGEDYKEGLFSWKGFLYYKWLFSELRPKLVDVLREIPLLRVTGHKDPDLMVHIERTRRRLVEALEAKRREIADVLDVYDRAFADLTKNGKPLAFQSFLLRASDMFLMLGERIGVISHITTAWRYRFPDARSPAASVEEVFDILKDFDHLVSSLEK